MAKRHRSPYPAEFRAQMVALVRAGRSQLCPVKWCIEAVGVFLVVDVRG